MARRLGHCRISLEIADPAVASQWTETEAGLAVSVMTAGSEDHDIAMELLLCLGQALWKRLLSPDQARLLSPVSPVRMRAHL